MASTADDIKNAEIHLIAKMTAKPGLADKVETHLKKIQINARSDETEPGCGRYDVLRFEDKFTVVEKYQDKAAVDVHMASASFQAFAKELPDITVAGSFTLQFYAEV